MPTSESVQSFAESDLDVMGKHSLGRLQKLIRLLKPEYCSIYVRISDTFKELL